MLLRETSGLKVLWAISQNSLSERIMSRRHPSRIPYKAQSLYTPPLLYGILGWIDNLNYSRERDLWGHKKSWNSALFFPVKKKNVNSTQLTCIHRVHLSFCFACKLFGIVIWPIVYKYNPSSFKADTSLNHASTC